MGTCGPRRRLLRLPNKKPPKQKACYARGAWAITGSMSSADLLVSLTQTDAGAAQWAALVERYGNRLWAVCCAAAGPALAEDAFQDGMVAIRESAGRFRPGADPEASALAWMVTVVHCKAVDLVRREARKQKRERSIMAREPAAPSAPSEDDRTVAVQAAMHALDQLPERHQQVIRLRLLGGMDAAQTAAVIGCPADQVRVRLQRALDQLRKRCVPVAAMLPTSGAVEQCLQQTVAAHGHLPAAAKAAAIASFTTPVAAAAGLSLGAIMAMSSIGVGVVAAVLFTVVLPMKSAHASDQPPAFAAAIPLVPNGMLDRAVTLEFNGSDLSDVLTMLGMMAKTKIQLDGRVDTKTVPQVNFAVQDMTMRHVLDLLLQPRGLDFVMKGDAIVVGYPKDLADGSSGTKPAAESAVAVDAWRKALVDQLEQDITINCDGVAMVDFVAMVKKTSKANIVVDPAEFTANPTVSLKVDKMKLKYVLDLAMKLAGAVYAFRDGAVYITPSRQ